MTKDRKYYLSHREQCKKAALDYYYRNRDRLQRKARDLQHEKQGCLKVYARSYLVTFPDGEKTREFDSMKELSDFFGLTINTLKQYMWKGINPYGYLIQRQYEEK